MKKSEIADKLRDGGLNAMDKLLDALIIECHKENEVNEEKEFRTTQGQIKGYRKIKGYVKKALTPKE